jgi:predicted Zn-dependent protease with MMP-like domain
MLAAYVVSCEKLSIIGQEAFNHWPRSFQSLAKKLSIMAKSFKVKSLSGWEGWFTPALTIARLDIRVPQQL